MDVMSLHIPRRNVLFGSLGAALACQATAVVGGVDAAVPAPDLPEPMGMPSVEECLDYGRSFVCHGGPDNAVRFWIESRTTLLDEDTGQVEHFYQCGSCKSERTFAQRDLFTEENYDFLPIFGRGQVVIFRRHAGLNPGYREVRASVPAWGAPIWRLRRAEGAAVLDTWPKIQAAIEQGKPIIARTRLADRAARRAALIEYPVKTMNMNVQQQMWQLDTGPIALPDLSQRNDPPIAALRLAFVAANRFDRADFVMEQPTPVLADGRPVAEVHHYSGPVSLPAENVLLSAELG